MNFKSNAPLLLSSLSFFHPILHCLLIAPCGPASLQSCHRIRSFLNPLVQFNYSIICGPILCVSRSFCVVQSILFSCIADFLFYGTLASSLVSSQLASSVSRLVSSRLNSSHLVPSRLVSRLLSSHRLSGHITLPPLPPFRLPWYQPIASHLGFSRLCSSRLVFRHTSSHLVFRVVSFLSLRLKSQVSGLKSQIQSLRSHVSCLKSQVSNLKSQISSLTS